MSNLEEICERLNNLKETILDRLRIEIDASFVPDYHEKYGPLIRVVLQGSSFGYITPEQAVERGFVTGLFQDIYRRQQNLSKIKEWIKKNEENDQEGTE